MPFGRGLVRSGALLAGLLLLAATAVDAGVRAGLRPRLVLGASLLLVVWQVASTTKGVPASVRWIVPPAAVMADGRTQAVRWGRALGSAFLTDAPYLTAHLGLLGPALLGDRALVGLSVVLYETGRLVPYLVRAPGRVADGWHRSVLRRRLPHVSSLALLLVAAAAAVSACQSTTSDHAGGTKDGAGCKTSPMTTLSGNKLVGSTPLLGKLGIRPTGFRNGRLGMQKPAAGTVIEGSTFWAAKVLWVVVDRHFVPAQITGGPVDKTSTARLRFNGLEGVPPATELSIAGPQALAQGVPSYIRVDQPGCYELRVATASGQSVLRFLADFGPAG